MNTETPTFEPVGPFNTGSAKLDRLLDLTEMLCAGAKGHDVGMAFLDALEDVQALIRPQTKAVFGRRPKLIRKCAKSRSVR